MVFWVDVPREGHTCEWVRVGFRKPVYPAAVVIAETSNPGSVIAIRGTAHPKGPNADASEWRMLWHGDAAWPDTGEARLFSPPLLPEASQHLVSAIEVTLDTTMWTSDWWSEIDAIRLEGTPPSQHGQGASGNQSPAGCASGGGGTGAGAGTVQKVDTWLDRMVWETDRAFYSRARFEMDRFGSAPPATEEEGMRRAAISMVHQNMTDLGCVYPKAVEAEVELAVGQRLGAGTQSRRAAVSGMAVEGEMRTEAMAAAIR